MSSSESPLLMDNENPTDTNAPAKVPNTKDDESPSKGVPPAWKSYVAIVVILGICAPIAYGTDTWIEYGISFGIQFLVFLCHAWPFHTEKLYDFTGMITYLTLCIVAFFVGNVPDGISNRFENIRSLIITACIMIWTLRLGFFLFARVRKGSDPRFENKLYNFSFFLVTWTLQGIWCYWVAGILLGVINGKYKKTNALDYVGWALWVLGFAWEAIADHQKSAFKKDPNNKGKFCNVGLWSLSRRPNYFGEIVLWIGLSMSACNVAFGADFLLLLSPFITIILLVFVSGIPLAEANSDKRYGNVEGYSEYKANTPVLIPFCFCWK
mmetsp:Transcript_65727/g.80439  ORF Transcript_65727/g.80439 Transcript_65727/m.80439 type:complete len:324 (+) Transcript_65727:76-1047(+)